MIRSTHVVGLAFTLAIGVAPLAAATIPSPPPVGNERAAQPAEMVGNRLAAFEALVAAFDPDRVFVDDAYASAVLELVEEMEPDLRSLDRELAAARFLKGYALIGLERSDEASAVAEQMIAMAGSSKSSGYTILLLSQMMVDDAAGALQTIERASMDLGEGSLAAPFRALLTPEMVLYTGYAASEREDDTGGYRLSEALLKLGWDGHDDPALVDFHRLQALKGRVEKGDLSGAKAIFPKIESPRGAIGIFASKRYDALFDPGFDRPAAVVSMLAAEGVRTAQRRDAAPDDLKAVLARAQYLRSVGDNEAAFALLEPLIGDMSAIEAAGTDAFWIVNEAVYALVDLGRGDDAIVLMERLIALDHERHPDLINMTINHGVILKDLGRYSEALAHAQNVEAEQARFASPYGLMFVWSTAVCSLAAEGKPEEAAPWFKKMEAKSEVNRSAMMTALLCLNDLDRAERLVIQRLRGDDHMTMLIALQDYRKGDDRFATAFGKTLRARWDSVVARPSVQAAIEEAGRIMTLPLAVTYWGDF